MAPQNILIITAAGCSTPAACLGLLAPRPDAPLAARRFLPQAEAVALPTDVPALIGVPAFAVTRSAASCLAAIAFAVAGIWVVLPRISVPAYGTAAPLSVSRDVPLLFAAFCCLRSSRAVFASSLA